MDQHWFSFLLGCPAFYKLTQSKVEWSSIIPGLCNMSYLIFWWGTVKKITYSGNTKLVYIEQVKSGISAFVSTFPCLCHGTFS